MPRTEDEGEAGAMTDRDAITDRLVRARRWADGPLRDGLVRVVRRLSPRRVARWLLVVVAVLVPCTVWGVSTASAQGNLGPHTALYEVTLDHEITVDLGPLGTLVIDSPLPAALGARVIVQEIPREATSVEAFTTLDALSADLEEYVQLFNGPEATIAVAVQDLVRDATRRSAAACVVVLALLLALRAGLGRARRAELRAAARPHRLAIVAAASITVIVVSTATASQPLQGDDSGERTASSVFDGTPLEGARITGRLAGVIDTYGGQVVDAYRQNEEFYASATRSVRAAWEERAIQDENLAAVREALRAQVARTAPLPTEEPDTTEDPEPVVMLVVSDLHCNIGMAPVIREVAEMSGAQIILNAGDTVINGTAVESYCVTAFADAVPEGATMLAVMGNHDGPETAAQAAQEGIEVLDGEVVEVAGVRILGDADPRATRIGVGTTLAGEETFDEMAERLAAVACDDDDGVDLLLVHDPQSGDVALDRGCVPAQISGHYHRRIGPLWQGHGTLYVSSSTAGANLGNPTIGPLTETAELTVLRVDPESGRVLDYRLVRVLRDASATVGVALAWPGQRLERDEDPRLR
jgi:predicted MPP superfamily phosphohydrolase